MAEMLLFHHAQGQTPGFFARADELRAAGHVVHTPDLHDGNTFADLGEGVAYAREAGFATILERGCSAAESLSAERVYAGLSLGVMPAQKLAQTRPGATHLRQAIDRAERLRVFAREDSDLDPIRHEPAFKELVGS